MQDLARSIGLIERGTDWREIAAALRAFCLPHGYDRLVVWSAASRAEDVVGQIHHVEGDWFGTGEPVDTATYLRRCPVNQHIFETEQFFFWTKEEDSYHLSPAPHGPGLHGLKVPIIDRGGFHRRRTVGRYGGRTASARLSPGESGVMRWNAVDKRQADTDYGVDHA